MPPRKDPTLEESLATLAESSKETAAISHASATKLTETSAKLDLLISTLLETNELLKGKPSTGPSKPFQAPKTKGEPRPPKLLLSTFDGTNPLDWLFQAEQYYSYYAIEPEERLAMVAFNLSGDALSWYKYQFNNGHLTTWEAFTRSVETRFGPSAYDNHEAALFKLRQTHTVNSYITDFEKLSNCVIGLPQESLLNCFLSGLKSEIQQELVIQRPKNLSDALALAKLIEDKLNSQRFRNRPTPPYRPPIPPAPAINQTTPLPNSSPNPPPRPTNNQLPPLLPTPPPNNQTHQIPIHYTNTAYRQQRRAAGLCFSCPEKFFKGHICKPQFHLIVDNEYEETDLHDPQADSNQTEQPPEQTDHTQEPTPTFFSLSTAAYYGIDSPKTLRITGFINDQPVTILIDSGSTHNIVQPRVLSALQLPVTPIKQFPVMVGNGANIFCEGICEHTKLHVGTTSFTVPHFRLTHSRS